MLLSEEKKKKEAQITSAQCECDMFLLKMPSHTLPSLVVNSVMHCDALQRQHGCRARGPESSTNTHRESASSFSFSVCMCECESDFSLSDLYSLLPAIASSLTQPPDVLLCTPTPWCYISRLVWTVCVCVVRPEWNDDMTVSYRCRHVVKLCLYSQLAPNELRLKWWYRIFVSWLIVSCVFHTFHTSLKNKTKQKG